MPTNNFLPFATADGNDAISDAAYAGLAARLVGFQNGVADPGQVSKAIRQGAAGSAMLGQVIVDHAGVDANDDGNTAAQKANLRIAIAAMLAGASFAQDTSPTANAIVVALDPAPPNLIAFRGLFVRVANNNTGPVTIALNNLGTKQAVRRDGTPFIANDLRAGQFAHFIYDSQLGLWALAGLAANEVPRLANQGATLFVRPDGSDSNDGSLNDSGHAFKTIYAAVAYGTTRLYLSGSTLTIRLAPGTYAAPGILPGGAVSVAILGDTINPQNCIIQGAGVGANTGLIAATNGLSCSVNGVQIVNTGSTNNSLYTFSGSITVQNSLITTQGQTTNYAHVCSSAGGSVLISTNVTFSGSMYSCLYATSGYITLAQNITITVAGSPNFPLAFATADTNGTIANAGLNSFSGAATGTRYYAVSGGVISTAGGGANYFPGSIAGQTMTGGVYV
jgi:hypothetical protein